MVTDVTFSPNSGHLRTGGRVAFWRRRTARSRDNERSRFSEEWIVDALRPDVADLTLEKQFLPEVGRKKL